MREIMNLLETVLVPQMPEFVENLQAICDANEMGFYFEEGVCWGS